MHKYLQSTKNKLLDSSGSLPRKPSNATTRLPKLATERNLRFEREKEKLKEAAAALDRDRNLKKCLVPKPPNPQHQISTPVPSNRTSLTLVEKPIQKKKEHCKPKLKCFYLKEIKKWIDRGKIACYYSTELKHF